MIDWTLTNASIQVQPCDRLVGRGGLELGDGLGALGDSVFAELAREHEADRSLDLAGRERLLLGVAAELGGLERDALEDIINERVHDAHALLGDARVGVDLLEDPVDVGRVAFRLFTGLLALAGLLRRLGGLLRGGLGHRECACLRGAPGLGNVVYKSLFKSLLSREQQKRPISRARAPFFRRVRA